MKTAYLTIDDGPSKDFKKKVDYLLSKKVPAIFFCLGDCIEERPQDVTYAIGKCFVIGNHSYSHPKFSEISIDEAKRQIEKTDKIIEVIYNKAHTQRPAKVFRFPHGDKGNEETKEIIQSLLREFGYVQPTFENIIWHGRPDLGEDADIYWTYNSKDYTVARYRELGEESSYGPSSPALIFRRMDEDDYISGKGLNRPDLNDIILIHDSERTSDLFFDIVNKLLDKNIKLELPKF